MLIQISSGQGPLECQLAVKKLADALMAEFPGTKIVGSNAKYEGDGYCRSILLDSGSDLSCVEGTVQWICKSPLRPGHKRKNWFVDVSIIPEKDEIDDFDLRDCRIEKYHSGGKGGQNVNKVETGVRIIHEPTGIVSECTEERSQHMNKQRAIAKLKTILQLLEKDATDKQNNQAWREHTQIVRGNPVRTYVGEEFSLKR
jgi:peptide chain release factor